jgi:hypothetical protein
MVTFRRPTLVIGVIGVYGVDGVIGVYGVIGVHGVVGVERNKMVSLCKVLTYPHARCSSNTYASALRWYRTNCTNC